MRRFLDQLYKLAGGIAALSILGICLIVSAQVGLNILARLGGPSTSFTIPSYADFAGFMLSTASFLALAYTLRQGSHIRVNLFVQNLSEKFQWMLEVVALFLGASMTGYATWFAGSLVAESFHYGDMSTGIVAIPIWIPQLSMVVGLALLTIALIDTLIEAIVARAPVLLDEGSE